MTVIRSILLAALMFWPATGWSQVFSQPQPGVFQGIELPPEMQRGFVSPGPTVGPQNPGYRSRVQNSYSSGYPAAGRENKMSDFENANDPRSRYPTDLNGPATEGYSPQGSPPSQQRPKPSTSSRNRVSRPVRPVLSASVWGDSAEPHGNYFAIMGAVGKPAVYYQKSSRIPLLELVTLAGGTTEQASGGVRIVRQGRGGLQTYLTPNSTYEILNGDIVFIESRRAATRSGLNEFSQPLRTLNVSSHVGDANENHPDSAVGMQSDPTRAAPTQAYLAFVGLAPRPIVVPVPSNEATLEAAMMWLKQDPRSAPWPRVLTPVPLPQSRNDVAATKRLLPNGTVLVFEPSNVDQAALPDFPSPVGEAPATIPQNDPAIQQTPRVAERFRGPLPQQSRSDRLTSRTDSIQPTAGLPPRELIPSLPTEMGPQRPRLKSSEIDVAPAKIPINSSDEVSYGRAIGPVQRRSGAGPLLFAPRANHEDHPQANSLETPPRGKPNPHSDPRVTPTNSDQPAWGMATTADFHDVPQVIPNGPAFEGRRQRLLALDEPRRLNDFELGAKNRAPQIRDDGQIVNALDSPHVAQEGEVTAVPEIQVRPWYTSTIGLVWLSSSLILLVLAAIWGMSRFGFRFPKRGTAEALNDLILNRLPITTETVRPPLGLRLHGRLPTLASESEPLSGPHWARERLGGNPATSRDPSTQSVGKQQASEANTPEPQTEANGPVHLRSISEQERILRIEFQQAWRNRPRQEVGDSGPTPEAVPDKSVPNSLPAPHFVTRSRTTTNEHQATVKNEPQANVPPKPASNDPTPKPSDDSAILSRALKNRRNKL